MRACQFQQGGLGRRLLLAEVLAQHARPHAVGLMAKPQRAALRVGYAAYMKFVMPVVATAASSNREAYNYLRESIQAWPTQPELADKVTDAGWVEAAWHNLTGGIVALHRARRP